MYKRLFFAILLFPVLGISQSGIEKARKAFAEKNYPEARVSYLEIYKSDADNLEVIERLGDLCSYSKNWKQASVYYDKFRKLSPKSAQAHYKYGGSLAMIASESKWKALGLIGDMEESFEKAIALNPKHVEARWALVEFYLQLPGILGGSEQKANKYANELSPLSPVDHYLAKGRIEEYFERYESAEKYYRKAHAIGKSEVTSKKLASVKVKIESQESRTKNQD